MQIAVVPNSNGLKELTIIELQGSLEINTDVSGLEFGEIQWTDGKAHLRIGNNLYEGKFINLDKPLLLMDLKTKVDNNVYVNGIIERKLLFSSRPKPIIKAPKNASKK